MSQVQVVESALRDAPLCATGRLPTLDEIEPALPILDRVGYQALDAWGGSSFGFALRELGEDPWQRLKTIRRALHHTPLMAVLYGQALVGERHFADDVVDAFVRRAAGLGVDVFRIVDPLNDVETLRRPLDAVKRANKIAVGCIAYSRTSMHEDAFFTNVGRRLASIGFDAVCVEDAAGEMTPSVAYRIVRELVDSVTVPVHVHAHDRVGAGSAVCQKAVEAGAACVHSALAPWSGRGSLPSTDALACMFTRTPWDPDLDRGRLAEAAEALGASRDGVPVRSDPPSTIEHPVPIGVVRRVVERLARHDALDYVRETLTEVGAIRRELGDPALIGPLGSIVAEQAVVNVGTGERYRTTVPGVRRFFLGLFGKPPRQVDAVACATAIGSETPIVGRPADRLTPELGSVGNAGTLDDDASLDAALLRSLALEDDGAERVVPEARPAAPVRDVVSPRAMSADQTPEPTPRSKPAEPARDPVGPSAVFAPVGGRVSVVHVQPGQSVEHGRPLVQFDDGQAALAPAAGKLVELLVQTGDTVVSGALIAKVEAVELV